MTPRPIGSRTALAIYQECPKPFEHHDSDEAWILTDRITGKRLGSRTYPTLARASDKRHQLIEVAARISPACAADAEARTDIKLAIS